MFEEILARVNAYDWLMVGLLILVIDQLMHSFWMVWLAFATVSVGILQLIFPDISWQWQLISLALFSSVYLFVWFELRKTWKANDSRLKQENAE